MTNQNVTHNMTVKGTTYSIRPINLITMSVSHRAVYKIYESGITGPRKKASRARSKVRTPKCRINWDKEPHYSLRQRIADSWILKKDLWTKGETLRKFCERMNMSRPVLHRYLSKRKQELKDGTKSKAYKRGRKTHLSESVMRHVCEGG